MNQSEWEQLLLTSAEMERRLLSPAGAERKLLAVRGTAPVEELRFEWKLKGTGKQARRAVLESCEKGQQVFIICDSNGENCTVINAAGAELGKLREQDAGLYHSSVEKHPHIIYIKKLRFKPDKPRVKILVIVHKGSRCDVLQVHGSQQPRSGSGERFLNHAAEEGGVSCQA